MILPLRDVSRTVALIYPGNDGGPSSNSAPEVRFPVGDHRITIAVVMPGNPSPEAAIDMIVPVNGHVTVTVDGGRLSG